MPSRYPVEVRKQVVELARSGTRVAQLAETFGMSEAVIYGWLKQERLDHGETPGLSTERQIAGGREETDSPLETELAVSRRSTRCSSSRTCPQSLFPVISSLAGQGFDVERACLMLGVSVSGYYDWKLRPPSARVHSDTPGSPVKSRRSTRIRVAPMERCARHCRAQVWPRDPRRQGTGAHLLVKP